MDVAHGPVVEGTHRDDLLGEDIEGVGRDVEGLDAAGSHALGDDGGLDQVTAELREEHPATDRADLVPGPTDALQPRGHGRG